MALSISGVRVVRFRAPLSSPLPYVFLYATEYYFNIIYWNIQWSITDPPYYVK